MFWLNTAVVTVVAPLPIDSAPPQQLARLSSNTAFEITGVASPDWYTAPPMY